MSDIKQKNKDKTSFINTDLVKLAGIIIFFIGTCWLLCYNSTIPPKDSYLKMNNTDSLFKFDTICDNYFNDLNITHVTNDVYKLPDGLKIKEVRQCELYYSKAEIKFIRFVFVKNGQIIAILEDYDSLVPILKKYDRPIKLDHFEQNKIKQCYLAFYSICFDNCSEDCGVQDLINFHNELNSTNKNLVPDLPCKRVINNQ